MYSKIGEIIHVFMYTCTTEQINFVVCRKEQFKNDLYDTMRVCKISLHNGSLLL